MMRRVAGGPYKARKLWAALVRGLARWLKQVLRHMLKDLVSDTFFSRRMHKESEV